VASLLYIREKDIAEGGTEVNAKDNCSVSKKSPKNFKTLLFYKLLHLGQ